MRSPRQSKPERSQRQLRVGEMLRHVLAEILTREDLRGADLNGNSVTVTEVTVSPDMRNATVYCLPLGGLNAEAALTSLNRLKGEIRHHLGRRITLKFTPRLTFRIDQSFAQGDAIDNLLKSPRVARDLEKDADEGSGGRDGEE